jgi:hypothetical protein
MSRIKGVYGLGFREPLAGTVRWLDPSTGEVFNTPEDDMCQWSFVEQGGVWRDKLGSTFVLEPTVGPAQPYPDGNPKSLQGAKKYSLRYLPLSANIAVNQALEDGAKKYGPANWREKGVAISVYVDAALRHINQFYDGKQDDASDSGAPNLGHAMACLAIIIDAMAEGSAIDDRPFPAKDTDALLKREVK